MTWDPDRPSDGIGDCPALSQRLDALLDELDKLEPVLEDIHAELAGQRERGTDDGIDQEGADTGGGAGHGR